MQSFWFIISRFYKFLNNLKLYLSVILTNFRYGEYCARMLYGALVVYAWQVLHKLLALAQAPYQEEFYMKNYSMLLYTHQLTITTHTQLVTRYTDFLQIH